VLAWVDRPGEEAADLWNGGGARGETVVVPPAAVPLAGRVQALRVTPAGPAMLHLRTAIPVVTLLEPGEGAAEVAVHETGALLDRYMEGPVRLGLRAVGGASLWGTAELTTSAVTPIGEGLGPAVLLPAGTTALFSFTVTRDGPVGIGVRATPDVVTATLLDAQGKQLGTGVVQMPTLQPGTYLLALRVPPAAGPVTVRPALAGIELPGTGPPDEVVRQYIAMAEGR
jgi:hypothetical protein